LRFPLCPSWKQSDVANSPEVVYNRIAIFSTKAEPRLHRRITRQRLRPAVSADAIALPVRISGGPGDIEPGARQLLKIRTRSGPGNMLPGLSAFIAQP